MPSKAKWTILTYIAAHNNLHMLGLRSRGEIVAVGSTPEVRHGVLFDGQGGAVRHVIGAAGTVDAQDPLSNFDSGDPDALIDTATWLFSQYPAERYGLVLWSHGTGWEPSELQQVAAEARPGAGDEATEARDRAAAPGSLVFFRTSLRSLLAPPKRAERAILFDDGTGHSLDTLELARVARTIGEAIGQPLDVLGMDACLMGNIEVAWELRAAARALVASSELVPGHSWPYRDIYGALQRAPETTGVALAGDVVDRYLAFYTANPPGVGDVTKVALDLAQLAAIGDATRSLAGALRADMARSAELLWQVQSATRQKETSDGKRTNSKFQYHLWDLGAIAKALAGSSDVESVRVAAASLRGALAPGATGVVRAGHRGDWFDDTAGLSIYLMPPGPQQVAASYASLAFARDTGWGDFLQAYHAQLS